ncbi:MAG: hypothetical protein M5U26_20620 [Planctomycetota bacterium]|nr:hypothetical protein [Planctomycetota bacterium]
MSTLDPQDEAPVPDPGAQTPMSDSTASPTPAPADAGAKPKPSGSRHDPVRGAEAVRNLIRRPGQAKRALEKDRSMFTVYLVLLFLSVIVFYFLYVSIKSSTPVIYKEAPPEMLPVSELVRTPDVEDLGADAWRVTYDFEKYKDERPKLIHLLRDWKGWRNELFSEAWKSGEHQPIQLDGGTGLPLTPLYSKVSWQDELEIEWTFEPRRKAYLSFLFNFFYAREDTGTALVLAPNGGAQFTRYRKSFEYDYPAGKPGKAEVKLNETNVLKLAIEAPAGTYSYAVKAWLNGTLAAEALFPSEWPQDRRLTADTREQEPQALVADLDIPPRSGFVAFFTGMTPKMQYLALASKELDSRHLSLARVYRVSVKGKVAEPWRADRTDRIKILEAFEEDVKRQREQEEKEPEPAEAPAE